MPDSTYSTNVSVCEGLSTNFDLLDLLLSADPDYAGAGEQVLLLYVEDANGNYVEAPPDSFIKSVDGDTVAVDLTAMPDFVGTLSFRILAADAAFNLITIDVQTEIMPVNDAPEGSDGGTTIAAGESYVFAVDDFGFSDAADGDNFIGVLINTLPAGGRLQLDGVAVAAGDEVSTTDIAAGKLVFVPDPGQSGQVTIGFQVRDDGGVNECGGEPLDLTPNTFTITLPALEPAQIGDRVWFDANGNGVQDDGEDGVAGVTVQLKDANGAVIGDSTTDANGNYSFTVDAGTYAIGIVEPNGFDVTMQDVGDDALDSDINPATLMSDNVTVAAGETNNTLDVGLVAELNAGIDIEKFVRIESPGVLYQGDVGEDYGKPLEMTFKYAPGTTVSNTQEGKAKIIGSTKADDDGVSWVVVSDKSDLGKSKHIYFEGYVAVGDTFTATAEAAGKDKFEKESYFHFYDDNPYVKGDEQGSALGRLQTSTYHVSDSKPIYMGDVIGNATLVGYVGKDGGEVPNSPPVIGPDMDADTAAGAPTGETGVDTAVFTYEVMNTGDVALSNVQVTDDRLSNLNFVGGDSDGDKLLDVSETWIYTARETVGAGLNTNVGAVTGNFSGGQVSDSDAANYVGATVVEPVCVTFDFSGNSSSDGSNGNIRSYTVDGVTVKVSGFAEETNGNFRSAYLGAYGEGLGVTDDSEGSGSNNTHTVDNVYWKNYLVFEFSQSVVIDKAYLGYVDNDSDMEIWIGTVDDPIGNHINLDSSVLGSLGLHEFDRTTSSKERWADFNDGEFAGNVLVIAADTTDSTPEDRFKLEKLELCTSETHSTSQPASAGLAALGTLLDDGGSLDALVGSAEAPLIAADSAPLGDSYWQIALMSQLADVFEQALAA